MARTIVHGARAAVLLLAGASLAQGLLPAAGAQETGSAGGESQPQGQSQRDFETLVRGDSLLGMKVKDVQGDDIGEVHDIAMDPKMQRAEYVAVTHGDIFMGGEEYVAVPIAALEKRPGEDFLTINTTKDELERAPTFTRHAWPEHADIQFWQQAGALRQQLGEHQERPQEGRERAEYAEGQRLSPTGRRVFELGEVRDIDARTKGGKQVGKLRDVYVDMHQGRLVYGLVSLQDVQGDEGKMALVPWSALDVQPEKRVAVVDADVSTLQSVAFAERDFPRLDEQYLSRIARQFDTRPYWEVYGYPPPRPSQVEQQRQPERQKQSPENRQR